MWAVNKSPRKSPKGQLIEVAADAVEQAEDISTKDLYAAQPRHVRVLEPLRHGKSPLSLLINATGSLGMLLKEDLLTLVCAFFFSTANSTTTLSFSISWPSKGKPRSKLGAPLAPTVLSSFRLP
ncbi:hypothetical protein ACLOJK_013454 [Asimina triloba]